MTLIDKAEALDDDLIRRGDALALCATECLLDETAIRALPARGVGVKPLVWDGWVTCHEATATTGQYVVQDEGDEGWGMWTPEQPEDDHPHSFHPTLEAAKAAAQADYEARILAALAPTDAAQAREAAVLREAAAAVRARYTGDNNREDMEVLRCEAAILALIGEDRTC